MSNQNKNYELTYAELKRLKGFENISEEDSAEVIFQLKELSFLLYEIFQKTMHSQGEGVENNSFTKNKEHESSSIHKSVRTVSSKRKK